jgi:nogalonic acid methyl ester cyclase / aklanonic acid methyl ester cyclase
MYLMESKSVPDILSPSQVEEENIRVVRRFFEAAGTGDTSKAHEFIDPDWVSSDAKANPKLTKLRGPELMIEAIMLHSAFADLRYEEEEIVASGNKVVAVMSVSGRHAGDYAGIPATGCSFSTSDVVISKLPTAR